MLCLIISSEPSCRPLTYSIGVALGQTLGGQLANPVDRFPRVFGGNWLLTRFPYLLPCIAAACLPLLASLLGLLFLKEVSYHALSIGMTDFWPTDIGFQDRSVRK